LSKDLTAKAYNTDFLVLADYSGKQKVITRFEKARMIVVIHHSQYERNCERQNVEGNFVTIAHERQCHFRIK